ncbi:hypothetical protein BO85DRAFT_274365 [Aspergillus piperis CBS 112811]|uniref:Uncharacterized protein n=1 Tax=Aspergillus piperis CBS 112811 TaxID=1448313 RepID=A0A8G1R499_9EURO|nr:hypothetical protein BO85DRAFT_274365 [Aspergillus piperis CBS 112811]RAH58396.1 hypothetical protein BO85DRAFT_274365 [Aspergillus piperis CBS 112811]
MLLKPCQQRVANRNEGSFRLSRSYTLNHQTGRNRKMEPAWIWGRRIEKRSNTKPALRRIQCTSVSIIYLGIHYTNFTPLLLHPRQSEDSRPANSILLKALTP